MSRPTPDVRVLALLCKWTFCLPLFLFLFLLACGGGGGGGTSTSPGGGGTPPPTTPDFTLSLNPTSVSIVEGSSVTVSLTATSVDGFSSQVDVQVSATPAGMSVSPSVATLTPGTAQTFTVTAATGMPASTGTIGFDGTSSSRSHTANLNVSITLPQNPLFTSTRTKYLRTDAVTEYFGWLNTHWVVYHAATSRFFVTDPFSNQVFVIDSVTQTQIASIFVPGAFGIDDTPDHSTLYVGTLVGDVYTIDPVGMGVKQRFISTEIGPFGFPAQSAQVLSDGRVALLGMQGGIPSVDGSTSIAIWNPTDNSIIVYGGGGSAVGGVSVPSQPLCPMGNIGGFARTGDRASLLVGSIDSDGTLCEINPANGQLLSLAVGGFGMESLFPSPDGNYIVVNGGAGPLFINAHTLNPAFSINLPSSVALASDSSFAFSADSSTLYVSAGVSAGGVVYVYNIASQHLLGWLPDLVVEPSSGGSAVGPVYSPDYGAIDPTGLLAGPLEEGFGFLDTTQLRTGPIGTVFLNAYLDPATGPVSGGTVTSWSAPAVVNAQSSIFFGKNAASSISNSGSNVTVTTPAGSAGSADVYVFTPDGGMELIPQAFSYGPTILEVSANYSTAEGGGQGVIYGYGFGPVGATSVPAGLSVSVGGQPATIVGFNPNTYGLLSPPFLLQSIYYTIPPGIAGTASDVSVTTGVGTATATAAMTYLRALKQYPLSGSTLVQGVYDPVRDQYYFTDANKVQVFSLKQGTWLSPISIPAPSAGVSQRLWGIALSPDASKLVIADSQAQVIYLLNPSDPSSVQTFPIKPPQIVSGILALPAGVAVSNSGVVWLTIDVQGGTGFHNFFELDTNTGTLTDLGIDGPGLGGSDLNLKTAVSADGTRAYFNDDGYVFSVDASTGIVTSATVDPGCCYGDYDLTLAPNQTELEATSYLYDTNLNATSYFVLNDREIEDTSYVYGTKFSSDGSLLFQPATQGLDAFNGRLGTLRARVALPVPLSTNYDAMVVDGQDDVLIVIIGATGTGIAVLDLSSLPEPGPLPYDADFSKRSAGSGAHGFVPTGAQEPTRQRPVVPHVTNPGFFRR
jgi:hypothetical protein